VADWPPESIAPGGFADVRVVVKAKNEAGTHSSVISIQTDDPVTPLTRVEIRWIERNAISVDPTSLDFGRVEVGKAAQASVDVILAERLIKDPITVKSSDKGLSFTWDDHAKVGVESAADAMKTLKIRLEPSRMPGPGSAELRIASSDAAYVARLPISWNRGPKISISPKSCFHSNVTAGSKVVSRVSVTAADGSTVKIVDVRIDGKPGEFQTKESEDESTVSFTIESAGTAGIERHLARIRTAGGRVLAVPVTLVVK
jgi:hypothetical protein